VDGARQLITGQAGFEEFQDFGFGEHTSRSWHHKRHAGLSPFDVGDAEDGGIADAGMLDEKAVDLTRPFEVVVGEVTGVKPAFGVDGRDGGFRLVREAARDVGARSQSSPVSPLGTSRPSESRSETSVKSMGFPIDPALRAASSVVMAKQFTPASVRP
jgi:hypothetical protein